MNDPTEIVWRITIGEIVSIISFIGTIITATWILSRRFAKIEESIVAINVKLEPLWEWWNEHIPEPKPYQQRQRHWEKKDKPTPDNQC